MYVCVWVYVKKIEREREWEIERDGKKERKKPRYFWNHLNECITNSPMRILNDPIYIFGKDKRMKNVCTQIYETQRQIESM